jgi:hypothetical protein
VRRFTDLQQQEASIRAARVVLNVHYYDTAALEVHRYSALASLPNTLGAMLGACEGTTPSEALESLASLHCSESETSMPSEVLESLAS